MKVLVTGAAGFIGFHLVNALCLRNEEVIGLDNINDYYDTDLKFARLNEAGIKRISIIDNNLTSSVKFTNYKFVKADIVDLDFLQQLFEKEKFDKVIHLAAQAGVRYSIENPHAYVKSNLVGFVNIIECCRHYKIQHFVYASSSSVYGNNQKVPFSEDDRVDNPISLYAATKKSNELIAHTYSHLYQLPTTGLRFFTVYGPWGRPDMAPMLFTKAILEGAPLKVFNNGDMKRDFTYIDDIIRGIISAADHTPNSKNSFYRLLNLGNSHPVGLDNFIKSIELLLGKQAVREFHPMQQGDVKITFSDLSNINQLFEYSPIVSINEGLNSFIEWYQYYYR